MSAVPSVQSDQHPRSKRVSRAFRQQAACAAQRVVSYREVDALVTTRCRSCCCTASVRARPRGCSGLTCWRDRRVTGLGCAGLWRIHAGGARASPTARTIRSVLQALARRDGDRMLRAGRAFARRDHRGAFAAVRIRRRLRRICCCCQPGGRIRRGDGRACAKQARSAPRHAERTRDRRVSPTSAARTCCPPTRATKPAHGCAGTCRA